MTVTKRAEIKITAKTDQAAQQFERLSQSQDKAAASLSRYVEAARKQNAADRLAAFDKSVAQMAKGEQVTSRFTSSLGGLGKGFGMAAAGAGAFIGVASAAAGAIGDMANRSMELQGVFQNLPFSIELARESTRGLITDFELAKSANTLHSFGVVKNAEEFAKLSQAAQALGQRLGLSSQSTMESLSAALGRNSKLMLDNLGIILSISEAENRYAKSLGKTAAQLTDTEKGEAFRAEAMKAIFKAAGEVKVATDGAAAAMVRFQVELQNVKDRALGGGPATLSLADGMAKLDEKTRKAVATAHLFGADLEIVRQALRRQGVALEDLTIPVNQYAEALAKVVKLERAQAAANAPGLIMKAMAESVSAIDKVMHDEELRDVERSLALLGDNVKARKSVNDLLAKKAELTALGLEMEGKLDEAEKVRFAEELRQLKELGASTHRAGGGVKRMSAEMREFNAELAKARNAALFKSPLMERDTGAAFDAEMGEAKAGEVRKSFTEFRKQQQLDAMATEIRGQESMLEIKLQGLEREREMGVDPWSLAQREADARLHMLTVQQQYVDATLTGNERLLAGEQIAAQKRGVYHNLELQRIAKERKIAEDQQRRKQQLMQLSTTMAGHGVELGNMITKAAGLSADKQQRIGDALAGGQLMTIGTVEMVKAAAAYAGQNYLEGAMHTAASIMAFAKGGMLLGQAGGGGGGRGGGGGGASAFGMGTFGSGGGGGGTTQNRSLGEGPPISRVGVAPPPRRPSGPQRNEPTSIHFHSVFAPDAAQIMEARRAIKKSERDDGDVN
jgi:hypothetical protein